MGELHHSFFWDHIRVVSGAEKVEEDVAEEAVVASAVLDYCHLINVG